MPMDEQEERAKMRQICHLLCEVTLKTGCTSLHTVQAPGAINVMGEQVRMLLISITGSEADMEMFKRMSDAVIKIEEEMRPLKEGDKSEKYDPPRKRFGDRFE